MAVMALVLTSCTSPCRMMADVGIGAWHEPAELFIDNEDTLAPCDLWLVVRYDAAFAGEPVELEVTTVAPDSLRLTERFTLRLPVSRGPAPLLRDTAVLYRRRAVLRRTGEYRMTIRPDEPVRGIEAGGIAIEKSI